jgi:hypothetical protein
MVYPHTCVHEIETQKEKSEKWGRGKIYSFETSVFAWCLCMVSVHGVCAFAAGDQKGRPIRLTGSRCELHFSFSSAPATATSSTNRTNESRKLVCRNDCISWTKIVFLLKKAMSGFRAWRATGTFQRYVHKTQVRYRPSSASLSAVPAQWPQELARVVFSRREKQQQNLPELRPARQLASRAHCKVRDGRSLSSSGPAAQRNIFDGDEDEGTPLITLAMLLSTLHT